MALNVLVGAPIPDAATASQPLDSLAALIAHNLQLGLRTGDTTNLIHHGWSNGTLAGLLGQYLNKDGLFLFEVFPAFHPDASSSYSGLAFGTPVIGVRCLASSMLSRHHFSGLTYPS